MRLASVQISRLAPEHWQVRVSLKFSVIDARVNGTHARALSQADYLADGLEALLGGMRRQPEEGARDHV